MPEPEWSEISKLFAELTEAEPAARITRLTQIQNLDPHLAEELRSLLASHESAEGFFEEQVPRLFASLVSDPELQPGERVLHFEIGKVLGKGSSAKVYMARDLDLERHVALKVTSNNSREASSLAQFRIDGIVQVYSEHTLNHSGKNLRLICLQLVPGPTLAELIEKIQATSPDAKRPLTAYLEMCTLGEVPFEPAALKWRELLQTHSLCEGIAFVGIRLAEILHQVHTQGGLHLDIKPANILLDPYGRLFLSDFNISAIGRSSKAASSLGGTPRYMSPEQARLFTEKVDPQDLQLDARADVYSLGIVLKEFLVAGGIDDSALISIIDRATRADKNQRLASAEQLVFELKAWLRRHLAEKEMPRMSPWWKWIKSYPLAAVILSTVISQMLATAINITYNRLQIVAALTPEQNAVFINAVVVYNLLAYSILTAAAFYALRALGKKPVRITDVRRAALRIPIVMTFVISLGWLPGAWIFPSTIDYFAGPVSPQIYQQFEVTMWLGWLISWTTSITLTLLILARAIYPAYWSGSSEQATRELRFCQALNRSLTFISALFPMSGALVMLCLAPAFEYQALKVFLLVTIGLGLINLLIVQRITQRTEQIFSILRRPRPLD